MKYFRLKKNLCYLMRAVFTLVGLFAINLTLAQNVTIDTAETNQVVLNGDALLTITNTGSLTVNGDAIYSPNTGASVLNNGNITSSAIGGAGIYNDGQIKTFINTGTIAATVNGYGVNNLAIINAINNSGTLSVGNFGTAIYNDVYGVIGAIDNSGHINVGGGGYGINGYGSINSINNSGTITIENGSGGFGIRNSGLMTTLTNTGSITVGGNNATGISVASVGDMLSNSGSVTANGVDGRGIVAGGSITTLNNSGDISAAGLRGLGIYNSYDTIVTLNNSGNILAGALGAGIYNQALTSTLNNSGFITAGISGGDGGIGINNPGSIGTLNNSRSIIGAGDSGHGIGNSGTINTLNNLSSGFIGAETSASGIDNSGAIVTLNNSGAIAVGMFSYGIANSNTIDTINNLGSITAGDGGFGIVNFAGSSIFTLNNSQGGNSASAATKPLTYSGDLPVNYNIAIIGPTHYGQLFVDPTTPGVINNFGIYGTPFLTSRTYASVLTNNVTVTNLQSTYDNMTLALVDNGTAYDLTFTGASLMGTQQSLVNTANALAPIYTLQNSVLANSFAYDCTEFGANNVCVSAGGRNTAVSAANGLNNTSALLIAAYRPHPNYRVGAYVDQNLSVNNAGSTVNLGNNTPLIGLFGAWNERLDATGTEVKVSAAYGQKNATITRQVVGLSEPGSGSSQLNSQGAQVTAKYGFGIIENVIVSPYIGMRYTQNNMNGYTEGASSSVTSPLTYAALNTNATTALAGVGVSYKVVPQVTTFASAGVESDTNTSNGTYSATGITGLTPVNFNPNPVKTRPTATLGAYYDIVKNQRLGITGIYRQEPFQSVSTTTVMATYAVGL